MIAHLAYVICDSCGTPASHPVDGAAEARKLVPLSWFRFTDPVRGRRVDFCPGCFASRFVEGGSR